MEDLFSKDNLVMLGIMVGIIVLMKIMPRLQSAGIPWLDAAELKAKVDQGHDVLVIDVRTAGEFTGDLGHINGAVNLSKLELAAKIGQLKEQLDDFKDTTVVVTCRTHNRSPGAARSLKLAGFKDIAILKGGMVSWNGAGYATTK